MKFTVVSSPIADHELANAWLNAADRRAVANAFDQIESSLKMDPHLQGREHPNGWRVLVVPPLAVAFRVSQDDRLVKIMSVAVHP